MYVYHKKLRRRNVRLGGSMQTLYNILTQINNVVLVIFSVAFVFQIVYILLFFVPVKKYPKAQKQHKIAVIIPAHNEEKVIARTVKNILKQSYARENYRIFVVADNCTDATAALAEQAGATVIVHNSQGKEKKNAGTAVHFGVDYILNNYPDTEFFVRFDADNIPHPDYLTKMNDAFESGVKAAKGYNHSFNFTQNTVSGISALWYIRDNAFTCRARSFLHLSQMLVGGGMMFSAEVVKDGFGCFSNSEDAQFTLKLARKKIRTHYVEDAVVYEDQPGSVGDLFKRNMRMGGGLFKLFFTDGLLSLLTFFVTFNFSLIDLFLSIIFIPIALLGVLWFPFYYVFSAVFMAVTADTVGLIALLQMLGIILSCAFILPFILQAVLAYFVERKKVRVPFKKLIGAFLLFPFYMIVYALGITLGAVGFSSWKIAERNVAVNCIDQSFIEAFKEACGEEPWLGDNQDAPQSDAEVQQ